MTAIYARYNLSEGLLYGFGVGQWHYIGIGLGFNVGSMGGCSNAFHSIGQLGYGLAMGVGNAYHQ